MRAKRGHRLMKTSSSIGNWLKRYWAKRTCRRDRRIRELLKSYANRARGCGIAVDESALQEALRED